MTGLVLRLAGPLQSWGEHSTFTERDTVRFPTRSGLIGLLAAAEGCRRGEPLDRYSTLGFTIRIDRPGVIIEDFHTVGGGYPRDRTIPTAEGKRRSADTATLVSRRFYLSDAVFVVAVTGDSELIADLASALRTPRWQPYLGRRSCPPDQPLLLRTAPDPVADLNRNTPVALRPPRDTTGTANIDFVHEAANGTTDTVTTLADLPTCFGQRQRSYQTRTVRIQPQPVPIDLCLGSGNAYREALYAYVRGENQ